ncbi:unannotated protein [freshwater metagenome]|uniref:Unannotated protein n=1 Tax=freshwater metagenome TaxID=449393 RepID=A0A6J7FTE1_9ZZZZ
MLQLEHGLRVEQVHLALAAPLVLTTEFELAVGALLGPGGMGMSMAGCDLLGDLVDTDPAETADRTGEVLADKVLAEADGLEDLCAGVGGNGADAHLRHDLQHALAAGLDEVLHRQVRVHATEAVEVLTDHVLDRLKRQVRVDCARAIPDEERHVMHLAGVAALYDQACLRALLLTNQMMVHGSGEQQRWNRGEHVVAVAIAEHDDARPVGDYSADL